MVFSHLHKTIWRKKKSEINLGPSKLTNKYYLIPSQCMWYILQYIIKINVLSPSPPISLSLSLSLSLSHSPTAHACSLSLSHTHFSSRFISLSLSLSLSSPSYPLRTSPNPFPFLRIGWYHTRSEERVELSKLCENKGTIRSGKFLEL